MEDQQEHVEVSSNFKDINLNGRGDEINEDSEANNSSADQQLPLGPNSTAVKCPSCRALVFSRIDARPSKLTWFAAIVLCLMGCWPCAPVPFCIETDMAARHYCPACGSLIGSYKNC